MIILPEIILATKAQVDAKANTTTYTATLTTAGWQGSSAPYVQNVTVSGITASDNPIIGPNYSTTEAVAANQYEGWGLVARAVTGANVITFTCYQGKPAIAIPIQIKVVR